MANPILGVGRESLFQWVQRQKEAALGPHYASKRENGVSAARDLQRVPQTMDAHPANLAAPWNCGAPENVQSFQWREPNLNGVYDGLPNEDWALEFGGEG